MRASKGYVALGSLEFAIRLMGSWDALVRAVIGAVVLWIAGKIVMFHEHRASRLENQQQAKDGDII